MRWPLLAIAALPVFFAALIATMPARLVHDAWLRPNGIEAYAVTGTVWRADLYETVLAGRRIARIQGGLHPVALLSGRAQARLRVSDAAVQLDMIVSRSGEGWSVDSASGAIAVQPAAGTGLAALTDGAPLHIDGMSARFSAAGCETADGQARTLALAIAGDRLGLDLPVLTGGFDCIGQGLILRLTGRSEMVSLEGWMRFAPAGADWSLEAVANTGEAGPALAAVGFVEEEGRWRLHGSVRWRAG